MTQRTTEEKTNESDETPELDAASTEHLRTAPNSERVVATDRREPADGDDDNTPPTDKFRRSPSMRPVGIDVLPKP